MNPYGAFGFMPGMPQPMPMPMPGMGMGMGYGGMPYGMPPPSDIHGKTRYKYVTPANDGLPPMEGAPPAPPQPGMGMPFGPARPPICAFGGPPPGPGCWTTPPPSYGPCSSVPRPPPPPPAPDQACYATNEPPEPPLDANKVNGQLATFPDRGSGYIFPENNVTIHLFTQNPLNENRPVVDNVVKVGNAKKTIQHAPCEMTFMELIERLECKARANRFPPYNVPGQGYPERAIGIQELFHLDGDRFMIGSKIMLTDVGAHHKLGDLWGTDSGTAGRRQPRYIIRLPV